MKTYAPLLISLLLLVFIAPASAADSEPTLVGWGIDTKNGLDDFFARAEKVGFDAIIAWSADPCFLTQAVNSADKHNIKVFGTIRPTNEPGLGTLGQAGLLREPAPWQQMTDAENAAAQFISAGRNARIIPYQWGGEPAMTNEVLLNKVLCPNDPEFRELFKTYIDQIISVPGIEGLAFDGVGYQNYRCCYCERCEQLLKKYRKAHPDMSLEEARTAFSRDSLVDYINYLADYARSKKPDIKTTLHIWPVFAPDPLYGNRLDVDYCGQTAAWYTLWPQEKIAKYSRVIARDANAFHPRQQGVAMIGYYDRPGLFPVKDERRVEMELTTILENGCQRVQVCETIDVLNNPAIAAVFRKHFKNN
jgi:hypothetical protein